MSASPADHTPGRTPNSGPQPVMRRPKMADPLVRKKDKRKRPIRPATANNLVPPSNGQTSLNRPNGALIVPSSSSQNSQDAVSGFTSTPIAPYVDYPFVTTKRALLEGLRFHVARFASKKTIDPQNAAEFVRPVRLHRRDPRAPAGGAGIKDEGVEAEIDPKAALDDKEKGRLEIIKAERDAQREAEMAQVAPSTNPGVQKKGNPFKKKTQQIFRNDQTDEQKAESKLRYEEALPWHLEDFENKNTWVGGYEAALSETYAYLVHGQDDKFRMVPLEKWYKFTPKNQFKTLTIEEAENRMGKKVKDPRWFMQSQQATKELQNEQQNKKATSGLFLGKWEKGARSGGSTAPGVKQEQADADDLDFQEDVADDEADGVIEGDDEDLRQAEERIKRDQLQANVFDLKDEKEYDQVEQAERKKKDAQKKLGKGVRKALLKREKNYVYDTDSENPYSEQSETDDTETERLKEEERKKNEEKKPISSDQDKANHAKSKNSSGASTKGANTPTQRPSKSSEPLKKAPANALKRSGSPNLSEASGNESTRKKIKKQHTTLPPTSQPPSRPMSPAQGLLVPENKKAMRPSLPNSRKPSNNRLPADAKLSKPIRSPGKGRQSRAGSGSENEAAGSGAEKSDGTRQRIKLKFGKKAAGHNGSANVSRAGSPEARGGEMPPRGGQSNASDEAIDPQTLPFPTAAELRARIPPSGIKVGDLLLHFKGQVIGEERKAMFTKLMRENSKYDKPAKLLLPL